MNSGKIFIDLNQTEALRILLAQQEEEKEGFYCEKSSGWNQSTVVLFRKLLYSGLFCRWFRLQFCLKFVPEVSVQDTTWVRSQNVFEVVIGSGSAAPTRVPVLAVTTVLMEFVFFSYWLKQLGMTPNIFKVVFEQVSNFHGFFMRKENISMSLRSDRIFKYSFNWAKLRFARYINWVFRAPSMATSRISAMMSKRSRRLRESSGADKIPVELLSHSQHKTKVNEGLKGVFHLEEYSRNQHTVPN